MIRNTISDLSVQDLNTALVRIRRKISALNTEFDIDQYNYYVESYVLLVQRTLELMNNTRELLGQERKDVNFVVSKNLFITEHSDKINFPLVTELKKLSVNNTMRKLESEFNAFEITINDTYADFNIARSEMSDDADGVNDIMSVTNDVIQAITDTNKQLTPEEREEARQNTNEELAEESSNDLPEELETDRESLAELIQEANDAIQAAADAREEANEAWHYAHNASERADIAQEVADQAAEVAERTQEDANTADSILQGLSDASGDYTETVNYADGSTVTVTVEVNDDGSKTQTYEATLANGDTYTYTTTIDSDGNVTSSTVSENGGEPRDTTDTVIDVANNARDEKEGQNAIAQEAKETTQNEADALREQADALREQADEAAAKADEANKEAEEKSNAAQEAGAGSDKGGAEGGFFVPDDDTKDDDDDGGISVICTYIAKQLFTGSLLDYYLSIAKENIKIALKETDFNFALLREYVDGLGPEIISRMRNDLTIRDMQNIWNYRIIPIWIELRREPKKGYREYCDLVFEYADRYNIDVTKYQHINLYKEKIDVSFNIQE